MVKLIYKNMGGMFSRNKIIALLFFLTVLLFKLPIINTPFHWDDLGPTLAGAFFIYRHGFDAIWMSGPRADIGHPPFFYDVLAAMWAIFGYSIWISHLVVILFSFLGVYFTYLLGTQLKDEKTGFIASLCLFFSPLYFAQSGTLNFDLPLAALTVMAFYFFLKGNTRFYFLCGTLAVLTKVSGLILIVSAMAHQILEEAHKPINLLLKKLFVHLSIIIILGMWAVYHMFKIGWMVDPKIFYRPVTAHGIIQGLFDIITTLFFRDGRFLLTVCIIFAVIQEKVIARSYKLILATNKKYLPICLFMLISIFSLAVYESFCSLLPRYLLITYPFFFIIGSSCLTDIAKKNNYFCLGVAGVIVILSVSNWYGHRSVPGVFLESNLEYLDQVNSHKSACKFIMDNYPDSVVITAFPQIVELHYPDRGYVDIPFECINFKEFKNQEEHKNYLVYYSEQSGLHEEFKQFLRKNNVTLLKLYESNGKIATIYKLNKN